MGNSCAVVRVRVVCLFAGQDRLGLPVMPERSKTSVIRLRLLTIVL